MKSNTTMKRQHWVLMISAFSGALVSLTLAPTAVAETIGNPAIQLEPAPLPVPFPDPGVIEPIEQCGLPVPNPSATATVVSEEAALASPLYTAWSEAPQVCEATTAEPALMALLPQGTKIEQVCGDATCGTSRQPKCCDKLFDGIDHCANQQSPKVRALLKCMACRESSCNPNAVSSTGAHTGPFQMSIGVWGWCKDKLKDDPKWKRAKCDQKADGRKDACCATMCAEAKILDGGICLWEVAAACMKQVGWQPPGGDKCKDLTR